MTLSWLKPIIKHWETNTEGPLGVRGQPELYSKYQASLGYKVKLSQKIKAEGKGTPYGLGQIIKLRVCITNPLMLIAKAQIK